ncbi:MAG: indole-3-glycerol phosphate synthase TrpC [Rubrobacter sp.]|jgi:indole-3-glycerol phosphate synthase|nr:indole-3-glycerol phosphate synthase TrpC [Rubrobacter sp.]
MTIPNVLEDLASAAKRRAEELRANIGLEELRERATAFEKRDFLAALKKPGLSVVSEIKRASPSAGFIRDAVPSDQGRIYEERGASCLSVLTEPERFKGSLEDLDAARGNTSIPVIRKDFTVDEIQIFEAATRADAVLLIAALFDDESLERYITLAEKVGLTALVEIHDEREADLALEAGAEVIGVNNRDLRDFTVDLGTFERLAPKLEGATLVAESGIKTVEDARRMRDAGADAVLVGEAAMRESGFVSEISAVR